MEAFFYLNGIKKLSKKISGEENIYLGIRPYGFHAGNMLTLVVYPMMLCQQLQTLGIEPKFNIYIFINDWEQDGLAGPNLKDYPFNIYPQNTTFQFIKMKNNTYLVDYWEPIIYENIARINKHFPRVKITTIRNSSLKTNPIMKKHLIFSINNPHIIANILRKHTKKNLLDKPLSFAMAVCPECNKVKGNSKYFRGKIHHYCNNCNKLSINNYEYFEYWYYHKPLAIPRIEIFNIDICITGSDHYKEGDFKIRKSLIEKFNSKSNYPLTLYAPILYGRNGEIMGKSKGNYEDIKFNQLIKLVKKYTNQTAVYLT